MTKSLKNKILDWMCLNSGANDLLDEAINHFRANLNDDVINYISKIATAMESACAEFEKNKIKFLKLKLSKV